jgi:hypothetical protein
MLALALLAIVFEGMVAQAIKGDALQKPSRNDAIGVDVIPKQGNAATDDLGNLTHGLRSCLPK